MVRYVCMFFHNFLHNITNIPSVIITYVCYSEADRRTHIINMINIYRMHTNYYCIAKALLLLILLDGEESIVPYDLSIKGGRGGI